MASIDVEFCRCLLRDVHKEVKVMDPKINLRTDAWVWTDGCECWEFHGPEKFYYTMKASNAYDARAQGWEAWLRMKEEFYAMRAREVAAAGFAKRKEKKNAS